MMITVELCVVIQLCLIFGVAGVLWPEKFLPLFEVLLFPWAASSRVVRANCLVAIGLSVLFLAKLIMLIH